MKLGDKVFQEELHTIEESTKNGLDNIVFRMFNLIQDFEGIVSDDIMNYGRTKYAAYKNATTEIKKDKRKKNKRYDFAGEYHHGFRQHYE